MVFFGRVSSNVLQMQEFDTFGRVGGSVTDVTYSTDGFGQDLELELDPPIIVPMVTGPTPVGLEFLSPTTEKILQV